MDYSKALTWYTKDAKFWPTVLTLSLYILSCLLFLPIIYVVPYMTGYLIVLIRNIQKGDYTLPDVTGNYWKEGIPLVLLGFALSLIVGLLFSIVIFGGAVLTGILAEVSSSYRLVLSLGIQLLSLLFQMLTSFVLPFVYFMAYAIYAKTNAISSLFEIENYKKAWQQNSWNIVIGYFIFMAVSSALSFAGLIACCIGVLPAAVVSQFIMAGVVGQYNVENVS